MVMTDPIADMLTRLRNAIAARKSTVEMPASRLKVAVADAMRREGYIEGFTVESRGVKAHMTVTLKRGPGGEQAIQNIERFSRPGCRRYRGVESLPRVLGGLGIAIVSTPAGVLSDRECREKRVGGEVLCTVW